MVTSAAGGGLCVMYSNSPTKGKYFQDVGKFQDESSFLYQFQLGQYLNTWTVYDIVPQFSTSPYKYGDAIQISYTTLGYLGNFTLPTNSDVCSDTTKSKMLVDYSAKCSRKLDASSCNAGSPFDLQYYLKGISFIDDPSKDEKQFIVPQITILCFNAVTGLAGTCSGLAGSAPVLSNGVCSRTVKSLSYTFQYTIVDSKLTISSVIVTAVLQSLTVTASSRYFAQEFSIAFKNSDSALVYKKSGNPGYRIGSPVLTGQLTTQDELNAISYIDDPTFGLTLPTDTITSNSIGCSLTGADYANRIPVTFGENTQTGCTMWLTLNQLNTQCDQLRSRIFNLQTLTAANVQYVGMFGNATVNNPFDWILVQSSPMEEITGSISLPQDTFGKCTNLLTSFDIQFLYTFYGSETNPQRAIVGARFSYTSGSFQWECKTRSNCVDPSTYSSPGSEAASNIGTVPQPFPIRSSVSFVRVSTTGSKLFTPPPPKVFGEIPDDIWYPFKIPS
ncbi:hypothetical protein BC833DRAFT_331467 [Globomyces pollinis-pini]|nr:hypothetical protein BC833DRAFT_331467 [Globomyces pollinis-pini]